jgi:S-adenosyl-L-methionine hydrolase (adenosine-forming)
VAPRPITFLSDYGYEDEFAGVCRAVIAGVAPEAPVIDITHGIAPGDIRRGALVLANATPFLPAGVHLAVVDPGVGTERRAVAVRVARGGRILVGPDNGLLGQAIERLGGPLEAVEVSRSRFVAKHVSATFHGRDVFAPVAAHLALGTPLAQAGEKLDARSLATLPLPEPSYHGDHVVAHVLYFDRFGNASLDLRPSDVSPGLLSRGDQVELGLGARRVRARFARSFAEVPPGEPLLFEDASGRLAIAVNRGRAGEELDLRVDGEVVIQPA